jgi:hypothetical protein
MPVHSTAAAFEGDARTYYFSYDMHLNPRGHQAVVDALKTAE